MPIAAPKLSADIVAAGASIGVLGTDFQRMAIAVSLACCTHFILPCTVMVTASGAMGVGTIVPTPPVGAEPTGMASMMVTAMTAKGLVGTGTYNLCMAISMGICLNLPSLLLTGVCPAVGSGVGVGKVVSFNVATFYGSLQGYMASMGIVGTQSVNISYAISEAVCSYLNATLTVPAVVIAGPVGPSPSAIMFPAQFI